MQIITSAAYLTGDLKVEFGDIPPSFLPIKNSRLLYFQIDFLRQSSDSIYLTIPQSYSIPAFDNYRLNDLGVKIIAVPDNLSLSNSVLFAINYVNSPNEEVLLLHGDTLFKEYPKSFDIFYVSNVQDNYNWGNVRLAENQDSGQVYAGLFNFSNQNLLKSCLRLDGLNFIEVIERYANEFKVSLQPQNNWMDFGHSNTYFRSKAKMTTERVFNNLKIDYYTVKKYSDDSKKMEAEANWFLTVPAHLKKYLPKFIVEYKAKPCGYELEYLYLNTLSELYVFGKNDIFVWRNIFEACETFLNDCLLDDKSAHVNFDEGQYLSALLHKTKNRLASFENQSGISLNQSWSFNGQSFPSILEIASNTGKMLDNKPVNGFVHGDFCFSNILFDFRKQMIKVIDPRGIDFNGNLNIMGDLRYDVSKLSHSIIGLYDFIIAGRFYLVFDKMNANVEFEIYMDNTVSKIQSEFLGMTIAGISIKSKHNYAIMIHLFLSMLPLHFDNERRQHAMLANVFRLYKELQLL